MGTEFDRSTQVFSQGTINVRRIGYLLAGFGLLVGVIGAFTFTKVGNPILMIVGQLVGVFGLWKAFVPWGMARFAWAFLALVMLVWTTTGDVNFALMACALICLVGFWVMAAVTRRRETRWRTASRTESDCVHGRPRRAGTWMAGASVAARRCGGAVRGYVAHSG